MLMFLIISFRTLFCSFIALLSKRLLSKMRHLFLIRSIIHVVKGRLPWFLMFVLTYFCYALIFLLGTKTSLATSKNLLSETATWFSVQGPCTNSVKVSKHYTMLSQIFFQLKAQFYLLFLQKVVRTQKVRDCVYKIVAISLIYLKPIVVLQVLVVSLYTILNKRQDIV